MRSMRACYDGFGPFIPELWADASLQMLKENGGVVNQVNRDFDSKVASYGDVVNTRRPNDFKIKRKSPTTAAAYQTPDATPVTVTLNQHFIEAFTIPDSKLSLSFKDLVQVYLRPAVQAVSRGIDRAILGRFAASFGAGPTLRAGRLCAMSYSNVYDYIVEADQILNTNLAPMEDRFIAASAPMKSHLLKCSSFIDASKSGDGGKLLRSGVLGSILNYNVGMYQNVPTFLVGADAAASTITEPYAAESVAVMLTSLNPTVGEYVNVAGNDQPTWVSAKNAGVSITLNEALKNATLDNAVVIQYKKCDVVGSSFVAGWSEEVVVDGFTTGYSPKVGQLISFGTTTRHTYIIIEATLAAGGASTSLLLDRPLEYALSNDDLAFPGPLGTCNTAFHKNALTFVTRPLSDVHEQGLYGLAMDDYGVILRVGMQRILSQGLNVSVEVLGGTAVLDARLAVPILG